MKIRGKEIDIAHRVAGYGVLIMLLPFFAMLLWLWLGVACIAAWLFVGPTDFCTAIYMDKM